ncbi:unnamed protein product [Ectocarpus sp. 8 AP-2014]
MPSLKANKKVAGGDRRPHHDKARSGASYDTSCSITTVRRRYVRMQPVFQCFLTLLVLEAFLGTIWGHFWDTALKFLFSRTKVNLGSAVCNVRENPWSIMLG